VEVLPDITYEFNNN
jgi:hypothetical protein